jgi:hypothetical protein
LLDCIYIKEMSIYENTAIRWVVNKQTDVCKIRLEYTE